MVAVTLLALAVVGSATAKDGVVAHLANPRVVESAPGTSIVLVWTLRAGARPFGASGIYVRLRGATISTALAKELSPGRFRVRLPVPTGGVHSIVIGLIGWRTDSGGTRRADRRFPIDNDPTR
jgi:hypothetical protein